LPPKRPRRPPGACPRGEHDPGHAICWTQKFSIRMATENSRREEENHGQQATDEHLGYEAEAGGSEAEPGAVSWEGPAARGGGGQRQAPSDEPEYPGARRH